MAQKQGRPVKTAVLLLALVMSAGCGERGSGLTQLRANAVILAFGDSLTRGTGAALNNSYPAVLANLTGRKVVNAGVPGEVTAQALKRLPAELDKHKPDLVVLIHGGNDLLRRNSRETAANLREMIKLAREKGSEVVMLGVPAPSLILRSAGFYADVAEETGTPIDDEALADILGRPSNKSDTVHPNGKGYALLAEAVQALLARHGAL